jgi:uncharacterized cupredoxin-like copper-binding protein
VTVRRSVTLGVVALAIGAVAGVTAFALPGSADAPRTIEVTMRYSRFEPAVIDVEPGETVRFVVRNDDPIDHEFILGDDAVQRAHERGTEAYHPPKPGEMSVAPLVSAVTTYTFPEQPGELTLGCHLPGHFAYGMRAEVRIG